MQNALASSRVYVVRAAATIVREKELTGKTATWKCSCIQTHDQPAQQVSQCCPRMHGSCSTDVAMYARQPGLITISTPALRTRIKMHACRREMTGPHRLYPHLNRMSTKWHDRLLAHVPTRLHCMSLLQEAQTGLRLVWTFALSAGLLASSPCHMCSNKRQFCTDRRGVSPCLVPCVVLGWCQNAFVCFTPTSLCWPVVPLPRNCQRLTRTWLVTYFHIHYIYTPQRTQLKSHAPASLVAEAKVFPLTDQKGSGTPRALDPFA